MAEWAGLAATHFLGRCLWFGRNDTVKDVTSGRRDVDAVTGEVGASSDAGSGCSAVDMSDCRVKLLRSDSSSLTFQISLKLRVDSSTYA